MELFVISQAALWFSLWLLSACTEVKEEVRKNADILMMIRDEPKVEGKV